MYYWSYFDLFLLIKTRIFSSIAISLQDWIFSQICTSNAPLHPLMVPLIEAFVHSIIQPIQVGKTGKHHKTVNLERFAEEDLFRVFRKVVLFTSFIHLSIIYIIYIYTYIYNRYLRIHIYIYIHI